RAATISRPLENMRASRVRSTRPHILPTRSCAADEARRAVLHRLRADRSLLFGRPARLARGERLCSRRSPRDRAQVSTSGPASTLKDPSRDPSNGRGTLAIATIIRVDIAVAAHHADGKKVHRTLELYRTGPPWTPTNGTPTITETPVPLT
ncbi:hypothetical protein T492DRAFT_1009873, partial [Pavlovales sp. CCMP2436]